MKPTTYNDADPIGEETLAVISQAGAFNRWMYTTIAPWCQGKLLEIGSGVGNLSQFFLAKEQFIHLTDLRAGYCAQLEEQFGEHPHCLGVSQVDLVAPDFETRYADLLGQFDSVFALNVVEHIEDDLLALANARLLLRQGGRLVILVPAYQWLYTKIDQGLGHYRRYTVPTLSQAMTQAGLTVVHQQYFNAMGILAWWISGKLQRNEQIPEGQMQLYNTFVPIFKGIDALVGRRLGLSAVAIGER